MPAFVRLHGPAGGTESTRGSGGLSNPGSESARMVLMTSLAPELNLLYPLNEFYDQVGLSLPAVVRVEDRDVPEPYKSLLVHTRDMTPTMGGFYNRGIQLRVLRHTLRHDVFSREIILVLEGDGRPVVFGAIKIYLERCPPEARR